jgi:hypothetical protein
MTLQHSLRRTDSRMKLCSWLLGVLLCVACSAETAEMPPGSIVHAWPVRPPPSATTLPGLDEMVIFERVSKRIEERFVLPEDLGVLHTSCGEANAFYDPDIKRIRMCDELLEKVIDVTRDSLASSEVDVIAQVHSTWVLMFLHELGHAFIHIFDLSVLGNEEAAVDDFAALLLVNAGEAAMAQLALGYWAATETSSHAATAFADEHGFDLQRYYSGLCLVYGSDPAAHADIVDEGLLPAERAARCQSQYNKVLHDWKTELGTRLRDAPL